MNILAPKKSKLEREQESGVNGVSLKKLSLASPLYSAPSLSGILISTGRAGEGEMTETLWTYVSGSRVSSGQAHANDRPLIKFTLLAVESSCSRRVFYGNAFCFDYLNFPFFVSEKYIKEEMQSSDKKKISWNICENIEMKQKRAAICDWRSAI